MAFEPTHVVPQGGVPAWNEPDGSQSPAANLAAGTELEIDEQQGQWAKVEGANGWTGWVDGGRLVARSSVPPAAPASPTVSTPGARREASEYAAILASPWQRLGAALLDGLLVLVTLIVGWLIWAIASTFPHGQTPAKRMLGLRVIDLDTGTGAARGKMVVRDILIRWLAIGILSNLTLGIVGLVATLMIFSAYHLTLWDRWARTVVVKDETGTYDPEPTI